jgi:hypothetical protein
VCAVFCIGLEMLHNISHLILLNYFINKRYGSILKLNLKLNKKNLNYTYEDPMCGVNQFEMININPLLFVKDKLFYSHKICTQPL